MLIVLVNSRKSPPEASAPRRNTGTCNRIRGDRRRSDRVKRLGSFSNSIAKTRASSTVALVPIRSTFDARNGVLHCNVTVSSTMPCRAKRSPRASKLLHTGTEKAVPFSKCANGTLLPLTPQGSFASIAGHHLRGNVFPLFLSVAGLCRRNACGDHHQRKDQVRSLF